ncbi:MAG: hypothetical protein WCG47_30165 [Dermatophilaceae bacterium]
MASHAFVSTATEVVATGFTSLLFEASDGTTSQVRPEPACFRDLNLDQLVASIARGRDEYTLAPFFREPLTSAQAINYRQEVLHDLENPVIDRAIRA